MINFIGLGWFSTLRGPGLKQLRAKRVYRALARGGVHRVQGAGSLAGVARGHAPLPKTIFVFCVQKMHN